MLTPLLNPIRRKGNQEDIWNYILVGGEVLIPLEEKVNFPPTRCSFI